jgi:predicted DCC family thiol-disulfide oxidoreductase YuxK
VILFDGLCNLCAGSVRFVLERDSAGAFDFASLQSEAARRLIAGRSPADLPDSIVLVDTDGVHLRSDAALRIAARLRRPWPVLALFRILPRALRDAVYDFVARRRYGWFGKRETCLVPTPELRNRFLDAGEGEGSAISASGRATRPPSPGA